MPSRRRRRRRRRHRTRPRHGQCSSSRRKTGGSRDGRALRQGGIYVAEHRTSRDRAALDHRDRSRCRSIRMASACSPMRRANIRSPSSITRTGRERVMLFDVTGEACRRHRADAAPHGQGPAAARSERRHAGQPRSILRHERSRLRNRIRQAARNLAPAAAFDRDLLRRQCRQDGRHRLQLRQRHQSQRRRLRDLRRRNDGPQTLRPSAATPPPARSPTSTNCSSPWASTTSTSTVKAICGSAPTRVCSTSWATRKTRRNCRPPPW